MFVKRLMAAPYPAATASWRRRPRRLSQPIGVGLPASAAEERGRSLSCR